MKKRILLLACLLISVITVSAERSPEAQALLNIFNNIYGNKVIICSMANVNWNITEAENVYSWTGKYPAMTTFDFIHAPYSKDVNIQGWIDYSDMRIIKDWWQKGGIVSCMWHWLQQRDDGNGMSFYSSETSFDPSKINDPSSAEYAKMVSDMDQIAGYFKQMKDLGIPVVWRPLHEAAGNTNNYPNGTAWFWWGSKGANAFIQLWRFMHDYFTDTKGLNNIIWVWNGGINDDDWYPGDEYVDVVGDDYYGSNIYNINASWNHLKNSFPNKFVALTECGNSGTNLLPPMEDIWDFAGKWLWAMPWYDYAYNDANDRTHTQHDYHTWFVEAMQLDYALDREAMKSLLDAEMTSVDTIEMSDAADDSPLYDLHGIRVLGNPAPGIYIRNGKAIVIGRQ